MKDNAKIAFFIGIFLLSELGNIPVVGKMSSTRDALVAEVSPPVEVSGNKVTVVGVGQVGMACAFSILTQVRKQIGI